MDRAWACRARLVIDTRDGLQVRIQVLDSARGHRELECYPTGIRTVVLRYRDLPTVMMTQHRYFACCNGAVALVVSEGDVPGV